MSAIGLIYAPQHILNALADPSNSTRLRWPFKHMQIGEWVLFVPEHALRAQQAALVYGNSSGKRFKTATKGHSMRVKRVECTEAPKDATGLIHAPQHIYAKLAVAKASSQQRWPFQYMEVDDWILFESAKGALAQNRAHAYGTRTGRRFKTSLTREHHMKVQRLE